MDEPIDCYDILHAVAEILEVPAGISVLDVAKHRMAQIKNLEEIKDRADFHANMVMSMCVNIEDCKRNRQIGRYILTGEFRDE